MMICGRVSVWERVVFLLLFFSAKELRSNNLLKIRKDRGIGRRYIARECDDQLLRSRRDDQVGEDW